MSSVLLGLRFLRSPIGRFRIMLMAVGAFVAAFALLSLAAIPSVVSRQQERFAEQSLTRAFLIDSEPRFFASRSDDLWRSRFLTRIVVADGADGAEPPPWLERFPAPGEVMLSPALEQLRMTEPELARRFPQTAVDGIRADRLLTPEQLMAVVGVTASELDPSGLILEIDDGSVNSEAAVEYYPDYGVVGFGGDDQLSGLDTRGVRFLVLGSTMFILVPTAILVGASARLSWRTMERRLAALRLIGMTPRQTRLISAVEAAVVALVGGLAGTAAWYAAVPLSENVSIGPVTWWAADVSVKPWAVIAGLAAIVATTIVMAQLGLRRVEGSPLEARSEAAPPPPRLIRMLPLVAGVVLLIVNIVFVDPWPTNTWFATFGGANILIVAGLIIALPLTGRLAALVLRLLGRWPAAALSSARIHHEPGLVARVTSALLTMTVVAGLGLAMAITLQMAVESTIGRPDDGRVRLELATAPVERQELESLDGVEAVLPLVAVDINGFWTRGYGAACEEVLAVATVAAGECESGAIQPGSQAPLPEEEAAFAALDGSPVSFSFDWPLGASGGAANVVVPPSATVDRLPTSRWIVEVDRSADLDRLSSEILGLAPGADITGLATPDRGRLVGTYKALLLTGMAVGTLITFVSTIAGVADRTLERRRSANHLAAIGLPGRLLRTVEALTLTAPLIIGLLIAVGASALSVYAYLRLGGSQPTLPANAAVFLLLIIAGAIAAIAAVGYALSGPRLDANALRSE